MGKMDAGITVAGAGLVGSLLSVFLARRGHDVTLLERRPDMRRVRQSAGRSINLAVSVRGLHALNQVGLQDTVLRHGVPMQGRMVHLAHGETSFQRYGKDDSEAIYSISRGDLNKTLLSAAEATGKVRLLFGKRFVARDPAQGTVQVCDDATGTGSETIAAPALVGTDGSASAVRAWMESAGASHAHQDVLDYGYKEFTIPPAGAGGFAMAKNALHIWPRGTFMLIALPNFDGSYTCTLFLPHQGPESFAQLRTPEAVGDFFRKYFADAVPLIPNLQETFFANPTGHMVTVKCAPWNVGQHTLLLGDAAHAIVPFFGQGMNCGFEDCTELDAALAQTGDNWARITEHFGTSRKTQTDAIADMAVENFVEMRDKVGDPAFIFAKDVEKRLLAAFPGQFLSRYAMVTFSRLPYRVAQEAGRIADSIVATLSAGLTDPAQVDLKAARGLIESRFVPFLQASTHQPQQWSE